MNIHGVGMYCDGLKRLISRGWQNLSQCTITVVYLNQFRVLDTGMKLGYGSKIGVYTDVCLWTLAKCDFINPIYNIVPWTTVMG